MKCFLHPRIQYCIDVLSLDPSCFQADSLPSDCIKFFISLRISSADRCCFKFEDKNGLFSALGSIDVSAILFSCSENETKFLRGQIPPLNFVMFLR
uniref:Uncharacterized protein n=1 Tax=Daphnia galeata TaxID=27404 RepID=A0A8J2RAW1_9CRUS|nr:unnamed protein product [Daphnia galeata]